MNICNNGMTEFHFVDRDSDNEMDSDRELMLRAAWAHLVEGRTQEAVARELGLTRAKTNRLISECRAAGLVRIAIDTDARIALAEERALRERFDLRDAWVIPAAASSEAAVQKVGATAGAYISGTLAAGECLAIGWGRTLSASLAGLRPRKKQGNRVVTLVGGMVRGSEENSFDIASRYARTMSAECCYLIAPRLAESAAIAAQLRQAPYVMEAIDIAAGADMAIVGVDDLSDESTLYRTNVVPAKALAELSEAGAVSMLQGEVLGPDGQRFDHPLARRTVSLDLERFQLIPKRVLAATGERKALSIRAVLRGGYCNILITDELTASAVLAIDR